MIGDSLLRPTERDLVTLGAAPTRLSFIASQSAASTGPAVTSGTVPTDECWVIAGAAAIATPGAAQFVIALVLDVIEPVSGAQLYRLAYGAPPELGATVAQQTGIARAFTNAIVMPGEAVRVSTIFNAGAASNTIQLTFYGLRIPRSNMLK